MYTSLLFTSHWPHPVTREAWKRSLYSGQPHASLKFGGSIIIDEENNAIRKLPAVLPISPASSILFYMPALLHFFRLLLPLPGALRPQTQPLRKFLYHLPDSWRDITPSMKPSWAPHHHPGGINSSLYASPPSLNMSYSGTCHTTSELFISLFLLLQCMLQEERECVSVSLAHAGL